MATASETSGGNGKKIAFGVVLAALALAIIAKAPWKQAEEKAELPERQPEAAPRAPAVPVTATTTETAASEEGKGPEATTTASYKDGTYRADGTYQSPQGLDTVGVEVTIKDGTIADVLVTPKAEEVSGKYQQNFAKNVKPLVIGKKLDEVTLDRVSGASLTPKGWNEAIQKIQVQAKG